MSLDEYYELDLDPVDDLTPKQAFYYGIQMSHVEMWCYFQEPFQLQISAGNADRICSWLRRHDIGYYTEPTDEEDWITLYAIPGEDSIASDDEEDELEGPAI